ncbi:hypothetical protein RHIZ404_210607 [Rhizobium sp. EC-SD404]|nr:hypothetical protein RHIZ404_210607 [Rhizobium sp. EC-SD404]
MREAAMQQRIGDGRPQPCRRLVGQRNGVPQRNERGLQQQAQILNAAQKPDADQMYRPKKTERYYHHTRQVEHGFGSTLRLGRCANRFAGRMTAVVVRHGQFTPAPSRARAAWAASMLV